MLEQQRTRLLKQLSLLGSNFDGEQIAAINAINRTLESSNTTWNDFIRTLDIDNADQSAVYNSGFSDGFQAGCDYKNSETLCPKKEKYYQMLGALEKHRDKLNDWSRAFVSNLLENWFRNGNDKCLTFKQCSCIERMYKQFC